MTDDDLVKRFAAIEADVKLIKDQLGLSGPKPVRAPWPKYNAIDQLSVPPNIVEAMVKAVPTSVVRDLVKDGKR